jgi:hypothetical protein
MRLLVRSIGIAGGVLMLAGVQNASAQIIDAVEFTTSFPFTVGQATVPAGRYTIRPDDDNPDIMQLTGPHGTVLFQTQSAHAEQVPSKTEVVFKRYGAGYVLKDIFIEGSDSGAEAVSAEGERHMAKQQAKGEHRVSGRKTSATSKSR